MVRKPLPRLRPGWALVRVRLAGICNTDIEILRGYHDFHGTLGHEFVGEVVRVGNATGPGCTCSPASIKDKSWIGRRVVGEINIACAGLAAHGNHAAIAVAEFPRIANAAAFWELSATTERSLNI